MAYLSLSLLGPFEVLYDGRPLTQFRTRAVQALLVYLACQPNRAHAREALQALLWPDTLPKSAQGNLRHALYHLRQMIPQISGADGEAVRFILADRGNIRVNPDAVCQLDVSQFEALSGSQNTAADLEKAVTLYRGDFLADFYLPDCSDFEGWAQSRRADLQRRLLDALARLADHCLQSERFDKAEAYARRQLEKDNFREGAHRQLMAALARNGRRAAALSHYQELSQLLEDELGMRPSAESAAMAAEIRSGALEMIDEQAIWETKASRTPTAKAHNLPWVATPLIGRRSEMATLKEFFATTQKRLVTITGPGGMGKTRLALAAAEHQLATGRFPDGVFFVALVGVEENERLVSLIAEAMDLRLDQGESQLLTYLHSKRLFIVLDNFEQLLPAESKSDPDSGGTAVVGAILNRAPEVRILVTSRERLQMKGEQVLPLVGLPVSGDETRTDALQMFVEAARRIQPGFAPTSDSLSDLNYICRLVEGMPLALELAAAWVSTLTAADIAAEIQGNLDFLETDTRDVPARHRSLRAVLDASWRKLSQSQQTLLSQLSVFRGGFSREAAEAVTQASVRDFADLINRSLLTFDAPANRYYIHELLRQYAASQSAALGTFQDRHWAHFGAWVAGQVDRLQGPEQALAVHEIQTEMANLQAALNHALPSERPVNLAPVLRAIAEFYRVRGRLHEAIPLFERVVARLNVTNNPDPHNLFWAFILLGDFHSILGQKSLSESYLSRARELLEEPSFTDRDTRAEESVLFHLQGYTLLQHEPAAAVQAFRQSLKLAEALDDRSWTAEVLIGLSRALRNNGDMALAQEALAQSVSLLQGLGDPLRGAEAQLLAGNLAYNTDRLDEALGWLHSGIAQLWLLDNKELLGLGLAYLQFTHWLRGDYAAALNAHLELQRIDEESGMTRGQTGKKHLWQANIQLHLGHYDVAAALTQKALERARAAQSKRSLSSSLVLLGSLALAEGDIDAAVAYNQSGQQIAPQGSLAAPSFNSRFHRQLVETITGESDDARTLIFQDLNMAIKLRLAPRLANSLAVASCLNAVEGRLERAVELYALARQQPIVANSSFLDRVVGDRVRDAAAGLPPAAAAAAESRGKEGDIWKAAKALLAELA